MSLIGFDLTSIFLKRFGNILYVLDDLVIGRKDDLEFNGRLMINDMMFDVDIDKRILDRGIMLYMKGFKYDIDNYRYLGMADLDLLYNGELFSTISGIFNLIRDNFYSLAIFLKPRIETMLAMGYGLIHIGNETKRILNPDIESSYLLCLDDGCGEYKVTLNYGMCSDRYVRLLSKGFDLGILELNDCRTELMIKIF